MTGRRRPSGWLWFLFAVSVSNGAAATSLDVLGQIDRLQQAGRIDEARAWQLRGQAILTPEKLPYDLAAAPPTALRCMTPLFLQLLRHRQYLDPLARQLLEARTAPASDPLPTCEGCSVSSSTHPLTVHYRTSSQRAQAEYVLDLADESWNREIDALGFSPPVPDNGSGGDDNLDLYLATSDETSGGAYTLPSDKDADSSDQVQSCSTYIALNEELPDDLMPVYVAHELNHACQAAMDFREIAWAWEVTATFMEDQVYDDVNDYYYYLPYFQDYPEQNLVLFSPDYNIYPYGAVIFMHFLNEALPQGKDTVAAELWTQSEQAVQTNEPDFLDAVDVVAREHGWTGLDSTYSRFALWRYFTGSRDDGQHFQEGADWGQIPGVEVPVKVTLSSDDLPIEGSLSGIYDYGTQYVAIDIHKALSDKQIRVTLRSDDDTRWGLAGSRISEELASTDLVLVYSPDGGKVSGAIEVQDADKIVIGVLNMGRSNYDAENLAIAASVSYEIELEEAGTSACSCNTEPSSASPLIGLLPALAIASIQRRRRGDGALAGPMRPSIR